MASDTVNAGIIFNALLNQQATAAQKQRGIEAFKYSATDTSADAARNFMMFVRTAVFAQVENSEAVASVQAAQNTTRSSVTAGFPVAP